ncbi:MAG: phosphocholine cytidylyltransferase family protein [Alphaproteobacteria bacterium]|nr:phosphocholine cytidylyltransferase family protein [Alphaproteobacteria bacterium]
MLAAGVGARLGLGEDFAPKALLNFGGKTLLQRHIEILRYLGVRELVIGVGHQADMILAEIGALGAEDFVRTVMNPVYRQGPITTLWSVRQEFDSAEPVILMDADVLYDHRIMERLIESDPENCFLMDREVEPGEEPVKLCMRDGRLVDFHKTPTEPHEFYGEWIGFLKLSPGMAGRVPGATKPYIDRGETDLLYEVAVRDLVLADGGFGVEEVTGLPWIEIDFVDDVKRAQTVILPQLEPLPIGSARIGQARG